MPDIFDTIAEPADVFDIAKGEAVGIQTPLPPPLNYPEAEDRAGDVYDTSIDMEMPMSDVISHSDLLSSTPYDPAEAPILEGDVPPPMFGAPFASRMLKQIVKSAGLPVDEMMSTQSPELALTVKEIQELPWFKKLPEGTGFAIEKFAEFKALGFLFKSLGLTRVLGVFGKKLAAKVVGKELAAMGGKAALLQQGGWNTFRVRVLSGFLQAAPENAAFLSAWQASEAARKGEPVGKAAIKGLKWGIGFSLAAPLIVESGSAILSTKGAERMITKLQVKFPKIADFLAGQPEEEIVAATFEQMKKAGKTKLAGEGVPLGPEIRFADLPQKSQEVVKAYARKVRKIIEKGEQQRVATEAYWAAAGPKEGVLATTGLPIAKPSTAIVKPATDAIVKPEPTPEEIKVKKQAKVKKLTDKALVELGKAERPRQIIEAEKTKELGKRAARSAAAAQSTTGEQRLTSALGQLKGPLAEYKRPDFTPLRDTMAPKDINALHDDIWERPHTPDHFTTLNTAQAWNKVADGFVPTRGEIQLLEKQWGKEFAKSLLKRRPIGDRAWDAAADISNFMRTMIAGGDASVAGRQLRVLGQRYPKEFAAAVKGGLDAYRSEKLSEIIRAEYESSEFHQEAKKHLKFFDVAGLASTEPADRPEFYVSTYPERIPIVGHLIRMGNRNYVETSNMFTQSIWDKLRTQDKVNGFEPTLEQLDLRGKWLMSMSGRPEIGGTIGRKISPIASGFFFAPRFAVSRFTSPTYLRHLASEDPVAREIGKETAKAFASFIGTNLAIMSLAGLAGVDIEFDPRSPDWGKIKIGNTRIDLWAGYQQAAKFMVQAVLSATNPITGVGTHKTQSGNIVDVPFSEVVGRFVRGKENPLVSLISDLYKGKTFEGVRPFSPPEGKTGEVLDELKIPELIQGVGKEAYNRMLFLWVQDFIDASVNDGWPMGFTAGTLSFFGNNTSSYEDTAFTKLSKFKDRVAQSEYDKNWKDLGPDQQNRLTRVNKKTIEEMKLQASIEGVRRDDFDFVGRMIEDEKKAGKVTYKQLSPENRKLLDSVGHSLGLSRKIGAWQLNDERYKEYQDVTARILDEKLSRLSLAGMALSRQKTKVDNAVQIAKDKAKAELRRKARE